MQNHPRPIAIAIIRRPRDGAILVLQGHDQDQTFYRPLGGGIEFGEPSAQTVRRELREEINLKLRDVTYLATVENIFTHQGQPGHEIVMIYNARLAQASAHAYEQDPIQGFEDNGQPFSAHWIPLSHFCPNGPPLYPTGLLELIQE